MSDIINEAIHFLDLPLDESEERVGNYFFQSPWPFGTYPKVTNSTPTVCRYCCQLCPLPSITAILLPVCGYLKPLKLLEIIPLSHQTPRDTPLQIFSHVELGNRLLSPIQTPRPGDAFDPNKQISPSLRIDPSMTDSLAAPPKAQQSKFASVNLQLAPSLVNSRDTSHQSAVPAPLEGYNPLSTTTAAVPTSKEASLVAGILDWQ
ncbi:hypothetical protein PCASD_02688 [Puccinia coronata f. sp. avenae]|uniref:Uncharacterized protein n=1 Tax=Puccinia coronata f. sp. avenae TaxID=200324 RepID=A0A2N5VH50_9BASI|nr:hypothetical protein PCASD_02688 [Puccinia coronata f. sp. avenae]